MKTNISAFLKILFVAILILSISHCKKDVPIVQTIPEKLYITYKRGAISECWYNGNLYYTAGQNAYDAAGYIYDDKGNEVAQCNYAFNHVDSLCKKMDSCRSIYICKDNIWGSTPVDIYGLSNE